MSSLGRNQICYCGSGKKYKRCCYSRDRDAELGAQPGRKLTTSIPLNSLGLAGEEQKIAVVSVVRGKPEPPPSGSPGIYAVTFGLKRPGEPDDIGASLSISTAPNSGSSHLAISWPAARFENERFNLAGSQIQMDVEVESRRFKVIGSPNEAGYLSDLNIELQAASVDEAQTNAELIVLPAISAFSAFYDIPLIVRHTTIREVISGTLTRTFTTPFMDVGGGLTIPAAHSPELRTLLLSYRDALNSNDPRWRFLCLIKIVEQLWNGKVGNEKRGNPRSTWSRLWCPRTSRRLRSGYVHISQPKPEPVLSMSWYPSKPAVSQQMMLYSLTLGLSEPL